MSICSCLSIYVSVYPPNFCQEDYEIIMLCVCVPHNRIISFSKRFALYQMKVGD
jgi:hypothetical protein